MAERSPGGHEQGIARWGRLLLALAVLACAPAAGQQETPPPGSEAWAEQSVQRITAAEQRLEAVDPEQAQAGTFNELRQTAAQQASAAEACIAETSAELQSVTQRIETLGEPTDSEAPEVTATRQDLQKRRQELEGRQASCRLILVRAQELAQATQQRAQAILAARLLGRGPHLGEVLRQTYRNPEQRLREARDSLRQNIGIQDLSAGELALLLLLASVGSIAGRQACRMLRPVRGPWVADFVHGGAVALAAAAARWMPVLVPLLAISFYLGLAVAPNSLLALLCYGLSGWVALLVVTNALLHPPPPGRLILNIPEDLAASLGRRIKVLLALLLVGYGLFVALPQDPEGRSHLLVTRAVYAPLLAIQLTWILGLAGRIASGWRSAGLRLGGLLLVLAALLAEWIGYRTLAQYLLVGTLGTLLTVTGGGLLSQFFGDLFDGLDEGRLQWQAELRRRLGVGTGERIPGSPWLRALLNLALWAAGLYLVMLSWGLSQAGSAVIMGWITEGFAIGEVRLVPAQIIAALLVFSLLRAVARWLRQQVVPTWLSRTRLDHGAREAVITISGYVAVGIAALVALSMAGINFASLALVAGALSVGIGFGLQNIVNNFVSGLILLFERPIRTGDWIVVGQTEGYVKQISIRSTRLETFDRSEVIIPNSELATTQVTNWQLRDAWGRIIMPVPVAYGSDVEKVREVLLRVGNEHPDTMRGMPGVPDPVVLFLGYAESALKFELRLFIPQIDMRLYVITDLYFAIDREFRAAGIHIPYPQRDVHLYPAGSNERRPGASPATSHSLAEGPPAQGQPEGAGEAGAE